MVYSTCYHVSPLFVPCLGKGTVHAETPNSAVVLGLRQATYTWESVSELANQTDFEKRFVDKVMPTPKYGYLFRIPKGSGWWRKLRMINGVLAKHGSIYEEEALDPTKVQQITTEKSKF